MNLADRKRLIVARSDLHREIAALEYRQLHQRGTSALSLPTKGFGWLIGGAIAGGLLLTKPGRGLARWVPTLLSIWRGFKG